MDPNFSSFGGGVYLYNQYSSQTQKHNITTVNSPSTTTD